MLATMDRTRIVPPEMETVRLVMNNGRPVTQTGSSIMQNDWGRYGAETIELKRTMNLPFINFKPIPGLRHPNHWDALLRFGLTFKYPAVVIPVVVYCFAWYWWILSIVTQIPAAYSAYGPSIQGLLFLGLLWGTWFAELFCSGSLSDWLVHKLSKNHVGGLPKAEDRLWLVYPGALLSASKLSAAMLANMTNA